MNNIGMDFGTTSNHPIGLITNNTERLLINSGGNISIGNTNNTYKLDVTGDINLTGSLRFSGTAITATASDINKLASVTATATELNYNDITTIGTAESSKALIVDANKDIISIRNLTATNLTGTIQTASQPNITSVGTVTSLTSSGNIISSNANASFRILPHSDNIVYLQAGLNTTSGSSADIFISNYAQTTSTSSRKIIIKADGKVGFGTIAPDKTLEINDSTGNCLRLTYNDNNGSAAYYSDFNISSTGQLTISPSSNNANTIDGDILLKGSVIIGKDSNYNLIRFNGTYGDANANMTIIGERLYSGVEASELLLFKGNDVVNGSGPDRIRMRAAEFRFQTYTAAEDYSIISDNNDRLFIANDGKIGINNIIPSYQLDVSGDINLTGSLRFSGIVADLTSIIGASSGTATASKVLIVDSNKDITGIRNLTATNLTGTIQTASQPNITSIGTLTSLSTNSLTLNGTLITSTATDINKLASITASAIELNYNDISMLGMAEASKALILDSSSYINGINKIVFNAASTTRQVSSPGDYRCIDTNSITFNNTSTLANTTDGTTHQVSNYIGRHTITATNTNVTTTNFSTFYIQGEPVNGTNMTITNKYALFINSGNNYLSGNVNIAGHNGSSTGLQLGGTLVTATAAELNILDGVTATTAKLNYLDISNTGVAQATKALIMDASKNINSINNISVNSIGLGNSTDYRTLIDCGNVNGGLGLDRIISVVNNGTVFSGFGAKDNLLKIQTGGSNGMAFYTGSTTSSVGTEQVRISSSTTNIINTLALNGTSVTATAAELNYLSGITLGTASASKVLTVNPTLDISGIRNLSLTGILTVGTIGSGPNRINFSGTTSDASSNHTVIAERIYGGTEQSELILFKGNDTASTSGPDRIRYRAAEHVFQTYTSGEDYSGLLDNNTRLYINNSGNVGIGTVSPQGYLDFGNRASNYTINLYQDGTNVFGFGANDNALKYLTSGSNGHVWYTGSTLSSTGSERMRIMPSGNLGIGTTGPNYKLDVNGTINTSGLLRTSAAGQGFSHNDGTINLVSWVNNASISGIAYFGTSTNHALSLQTNNTDRMVITNTGYIGIGASPSYPLHVTGGATYSGSFIFYARSGSNSNIGSATSNPDTTIYASGRVTAGEFNAFSDSRIKKNINDINDISALNILRLIEPKKYNYIDTLNKTNQPVWGFLAQQVSEVLDYSVTIITDYIPNIFQLSNKSILENGDCILSCINFINYDSNGTGKIKLIDSNDKTIYVTIKNKINNTSFSINEILENEEYFIYGEEVNNYHSLNKDSIFTITTAAVQEIDRTIIEQKNKIENLENENQQLKDQINNILLRLQNLENNN